MHALAFFTVLAIFLVLEACRTVAPPKPSTTDPAGADAPGPDARSRRL